MNSGIRGLFHIQFRFRNILLTGNGGSESKVMASQFESVEKSLEKHLPPAELAEVRRILYGKELR